MYGLGESKLWNSIVTAGYAILFWASGAHAELPKILTPAFHTAPQICADARALHPGKRLALVAVKNDLCDFEGKACLNVLRTLSDACNRFVQDEFAVYQTRYYRCVPGHRELGCNDTPGNEMLQAEWGMTGPDLVVLDVQDCKIVGRTGAGIDDFNSPDRAKRILSMRAQLLRVPGVAEKLGLDVLTAPAAADLSCGVPERSLDEVWGELDSQWLRTQSTTGPHTS